MTLNKKQRIATVSVAGSTLWFTAWATLGYFTGLRGIGVGWPAFWAVGGISLIVPAIIAVLAGFIGLSSYWIQKGEK